MTFFGAALLTAITTAALAAGAIFTAGFAYLAFRGQSEQLDLQRQQLDDQRRASEKQAEVLTLQADALRESLREATERRLDQEKMVHAWQTTEDSPEPAVIFANVKNLSQHPLYDVTIQWLSALDLASIDNEEERAKIKSAPQLVPGELLTDSSDDLGPYARWSVAFTGHDGRHWRAYSNGYIKEVAQQYGS
jgi:hypothetical protein